jgi:hypothetical protein
MSVEFVLKLIGKYPVDKFEWQDKHSEIENGKYFDKKTINGVTFHLKYFEYVERKRKEKFPFDDFFNYIRQELDSGRYVAISLQTGEKEWHMYIIFFYTKDDEFKAVTFYHNNPKPQIISDIKKKVTEMNGTDILTYTLDRN